MRTAQVVAYLRNLHQHMIHVHMYIQSDRHFFRNNIKV